MELLMQEGRLLLAVGQGHVDITENYRDFVELYSSVDINFRVDAKFVKMSTSAEQLSSLLRNLDGYRPIKLNALGSPTEASKVTYTKANTSLISSGGYARNLRRSGVKCTEPALLKNVYITTGTTTRVVVMRNSLHITVKGAKTTHELIRILDGVFAANYFSSAKGFEWYSEAMHQVTDIVFTLIFTRYISKLL